MHRSISMTALLVVLGITFCSEAAALITGGERILFVGNNMTGYTPPGVPGGLDVAVRSILSSASINVTTECAALPGSGELIYVYNQGLATEKIKTGNYDLVVLQGWIHAENYPPGAKDTLFEAVRLFNEVITASGGKTMLFMTYPNIFHAFRPDLANYETVSSITAASYIAAANRIGGAPIAPVGYVFRTFVKSPPAGTDAWLLYEADIWRGDRAEPHAQLPSQYGQLLTAYIFCKVLTGKSPIGLKQTYYSAANPKIDSVLQYRAETVTSKWLELNKPSGVIPHAGISGYPAAGAPEQTPSLFLLDGSTYRSGAKGIGTRASNVSIGRNGRSAARSRFTNGTNEKGK